MDSSLDQYKNYLGGAIALSVPDVAYNRAGLEYDIPEEKVGDKRLQGINIVSTSPFLNGMQTDSSVVQFEQKKGSKTMIKPEDMARNTGDALAFAALEVELRRRNLMDWTPDGVVLSKLESPTDEPMKSVEHDARQAQLFNVGIQGPAITTSWTSDVRDHKLEVQPLDKVFICMVADLSYTLDPTGNNKFEELREARNDTMDKLAEYNAAIEKGDKTGLADKKKALEDALAAANTKANEYTTEVSGGTQPIYLDKLQKVKEALKDKKDAKTDAEKADAEKKLKAAKADLAEQWEPPKDKLVEYPPNSGKMIMDSEETKEFIRQNELIRLNRKIPTQAVLTNFRLQRTTSSHMSNYSYYRQGDNNSRLGLKLGKLIKDGDKIFGVREVIVGGWCIGTVIDSAATRSTVGFQTVKTHPTSMAINVNVNVQWWSGDKLHKHFMDQGGQVLMRGQKRKMVSDRVDPSKLVPESLPVEEKELVAPQDEPTMAELGGERPETMISPEPRRNIRQRLRSASAFGAAAPAAPAAPSRARAGSSRRA